MPVEFKESTAIFTETVTVEDAEKIFEWFLTAKEPVVDMTECLHIHTSVLQMLAIFKPHVKLPDDENLKLWIKSIGGEYA